MWLHIDLTPVVRKLDNDIRWINRYPVNSIVCFTNTYHWIVIYLVDWTFQLSNSRGLIVSVVPSTLRYCARSFAKCRPGTHFAVSGSRSGPDVWFDSRQATRADDNSSLFEKFSLRMTDCRRNFSLENPLIYPQKVYAILDGKRHK